MCSDHLSKFPTRSWTIFALACLFVATISCVNLFYYDDLFDWFHFRNLNTRNATVLDAMMIQRKVSPFLSLWDQLNSRHFTLIAD